MKNVIKCTRIHRKYYFALIHILLVSAFAEHSLGGWNRTLGAFSYLIQSEKYKFAGDFCAKEYYMCSVHTSLCQSKSPFKTFSITIKKKAGEKLNVTLSMIYTNEREKKKTKWNQRGKQAKKITQGVWHKLVSDFKSK